MLQKTQMSIRHALLFCLAFCLTALLINSCKKSDTIISNSTKKEIIEETPQNFFNLPANASPVLKRIAKELERQNKSKEFITAFIAKEGFPIWGKSRIEKHKQNGNTASFDADGLEDTTVYIPLVVSADHYVTGFLKATVDDSVRIQIYRQNDYVNFPFQTPTSSTNVTTAENFAMRLMTMDRDVFGSTEFEIKDKRIFHNSTDYSDTATITKKFVKLSDSTSGAGDDDSFADGTTINNYQYEVCWSVTVYYYICGGGFSGSGNNNTVGCSWYEGSLSYCTTYETGGGGGGGNPGGGNPGGGGGTWPFPPTGGGGGGAPCTAEFGASITNSFIPLECNPSGGNPWPPVQPSAERDVSIGNDHTDIQWWNSTTNDYPAQMLPSWNDVNSNYPKKSDGTEMCGTDVYTLVGGQVLANMPSDPYPNACAVRVSRALLYSGITIPVIPGHTFQGADGKNYFLSSAKLYDFMKKTFKIPPNASNSIETFTKS